MLAGDIHHYNRYVSADGDQQRITAGAGGTFLHPTNHLRREFEWPADNGTTTFRQEQLYPDAARSRRLRWGTLLAPFKNPSFMVFVGAFYVVFTLAVRFAVPDAATLGLNIALRESDPGLITQAIFNNPISFVLAIALLGIFIVFADAKRSATRILVGTLHWVCQLVLLVVVIWGVAQVAIDLPGLNLGVEVLFLEFTLTMDTFVLFVGVAVLGGYLASQLFAIYLFVMFTCFGRHATHAFSAQRIEDYRCFLRLHVGRDGSLTIYPVGVRQRAEAVEVPAPRRRAPGRARRPSDRGAPHRAADRHPVVARRARLDPS